MLYTSDNTDLSKLLADSIYAYAIDNGLIPIAISCEANQLLSWLDEINNLTSEFLLLRIAIATSPQA